MESINNNYLSAIGQQLQYIHLHGLPGLQYGQYNLPDVNKIEHWNKATTTASRCPYELVVKTSFAGTDILIRILLNLNEPWVSPDFIIEDAHFMDNISNEDLQLKMPILSSWNFMEKDALYNLLTQLLDLFKSYQRNALDAHEIPLYEYNNLMSTLGINENDIEFSVSGGNGWLYSVLLRLPIDLTDIPPILTKGNPGSDETFLHIYVKKNNSGSSAGLTPRLYLSPCVKKLTNDSKNLSFPLVPPDSSPTDYAVLLRDSLQEQIKETINRFEKRKKIIAQLLCQFGNCVMEYDAELFMKFSFMLNIGEYYAIIIIDLPEDMTEDPPEITLISPQFENVNGPLSFKTTCKKFNTKSSEENIVDGIIASLRPRLGDFKNWILKFSKKLDSKP